MTIESLKLCQLCGCSLRASSDGEYSRCVSCGSVRTKYDYDANVYQSGYANTYIRYAATEINTPLNLCRLGLVSRWLKTDGKLLDMGCCVGEFLRFAEKYYSCTGFEPNKEAVRLARKRVDSPIVTSLENLGSKADCVTMFDVLEHIQDPIAAVSSLVSTYMAPNSVLVLTTPNADAIAQWNESGMQRWKHYKPREHLHIFTEKGLENLCAKVGLEPVYWGREESDIRPGNPDGDIMTLCARKK